MSENTKIFRWVGGVIIVIGILSISFGWLRNGSETSKTNEVEVSAGAEMLVSKSTTPLYTSEDVLLYEFNVPKGATSSLSTDDRTIIISDAATGDRKMLVYLSNEKDRGHTPETYFNDIILPKIDADIATSKLIFGNTTWHHIESATMQWSIASVKDGAWLIVTESSKDNNEMAESVLKSFATK